MGPINLKKEHREIAADAVAYAKGQLDHLVSVIDSRSGALPLPADVRLILKLLEDLRRFLDAARSPGDIVLPKAADKILRLVLIPYRRSLVAQIERKRASLVHAEMLAQLDERLQTLGEILALDWFAAADRLRYPRLADFLSREELEAVERRPGLSERVREPKFEILLPVSLVYSDLPVLRAACDDRGSGVAVAFVDVDNFKEFNTALTEPVVDREVLPPLMRLVERRIYGHGYVYRYGGDELLIVMPSASQAVAIALLAELRRDAAAARYRGTEMRTRLSVGLALAGADSPYTDRELLQKASDAKKYAKMNGRDRIATYRTTWMRHSETYCPTENQQAKPPSRFQEASS